MERNIEIMSPAGSYESLMAAIQAGANAVYFGIEQLNMRARSSINFTLDDLKKIAEIAKEHHVRTYITLNTIMYDHDISLMKKIINAAKNHSISAIIASDQAAIHYALTVGMEVHISTQVNISNLETVKFYSHFADVMVLARELSLIQIKDIIKGIEKEKIKGPSGNLIKIELFAHGALCMAISGKCYISLHTHNASANRGACVQNCRKSYEVKDKEDGHLLEIDNEYILSPKDLCTIGFLDQILAIGISVLKIEGRGRSPEYVKTVTQCYREAVDAVVNKTYSQQKVKVWLKKLESVYNRGFWGGYYLGQKLGEWTDGYGSQATQYKQFLGKGVKYFPKINVAEFILETHYLQVGDEILITGPTTGVIESIVSEIRVEDKKVSRVEKNIPFSIPLNTTIRSSDKLYKIIKKDDTSYSPKE